MSRRRLVAAVSAAVLLALGGLVAALVVGVTQTGPGRAWVLRQVVDALGPRVQGTLRVARLDGNLLTGVTLDSLEMRTADDSLFVRVERARIQFDPRDLVDRRILLRRVELTRPVVRIAQREDGQWNYRAYFGSGVPKRKRAAGRGFGDYVVADSVVVRDGTFLLTLPWHPADSLRGARRDSAIRVNLARRDAEIRRRDAGHYQRTWRWDSIFVESPYVRLADPDSIGRQFVIGRASTVEHDPPFRWRNVAAHIRMLGESAWVDVPHFDLPASTGRGRGKLVWGSGLPNRYDFVIRGDSVAMRDIAWVYPTLPRTGGGSMELRVRNDPRNLRVIDYALRDLDVRTTRSRLRGAMTYGVGGPVLVVKDVDLIADPVDFDLLRTFAGGPFPYDWQGTLTGTVRARGGPLNRFVVDDARLTYSDRHVPGAVSRLTGRGGLDILDPEFTTFRDFAVDVASLDLRTLQFLNPSFPRLGGTVAGRAVLDSTWLDVRFRDAQLAHRDGPAPPTEVTGRGRVTYGEEMRYDLELEARPLSLTTLARSYPALPLRGLVSGPVRVRGTVEALELSLALAGAAGSLSFDGLVDAFEPGYGAVGTFAASQLDLRTLFGDPRLPVTTLVVRGDVDARGATPADLAGRIGVDLGRSTVDGTRVYGGTARLAFDAGLLRVDTLDVESVMGRLLAGGGLGLGGGRADSLTFRVTVDSLGGLRRWLGARVPTTFGEAPEPARDSLAGALRLRGTLAGSVDTAAGAPPLRLDATLAGRELAWGGTRAQRLDGRLAVDDLRRFTGVALTFGADSLALGRLALSRATASFVADSVATGAGAPERGVADAGALGMRGAAAAGVRVRAGRFELRAGTDSGAALAVQGRTTVAAESTVVVLDSTRLTARPGRDYLLAAPARLVARTVNNAVALDSVVLLGPALALAGPMRARLALAGALQDTGAVTGRAALEGVPLADLLAVVGVDTARYAGRVDVGVTLAGTRVDPRLAVRGDARALTLAGVAVERASLEGTYGDRRLQGAMGVFRDGRQLLVANATLPVNLALVPGTPRTVEAPLQGSVRADSLDLALLAALAPSLASDVRGRVRTSLDLSGTWAHPQIFGALRLADGAATVVPAGVRLQALDADVTLRGDTLSIARVFARSGGPGDSLSLGGRVFFGDPQDPRLDLRLAARNFLGIDRPRLATLWGSTPTPLTVTGSYRNALVRGAVRLERGRIAIPELIDKRVVDLNEYRDVVDTTVFRNRSLLPGAPSAFVEGLRLDDVTLTVGNDVWLRSPESNIKLSGTLAVTRAISRDRGRQEAQLALLGALGVERGTYRLDLLPLAQPVFDVEPGTLRFFGSGDLNPTLDVRAVHVVRQLRQTSNRPDVRVQVNIGGTLNQPTLRLSSADEPPIPDTDLISYLVTGEPAAAIFGQAQASDQAAAAASIVSRLAGSLVSGALSRSGPFDIVQVQTGAVTGSASQPGAQTNIASILASTRLGVGGQLGQRTFYTFSTGFCGLRPQEQSQNFLSTFYRGLGFRVERRLTPSVSLQVGLEPGSQQLACLNDNSRFFFQQTPTQGAIDFSKSWSF